MNNYYDNKMDNLEEIDQFLETYNLLKLNQEEIESMNRSIISNKIKSVIKKILKKQKYRTRQFHR